jgi:hypothetical protein
MSSERLYGRNRGGYTAGPDSPLINHHRNIGNQAVQRWYLLDNGTGTPGLAGGSYEHTEEPDHFSRDVSTDVIGANDARIYETNPPSQSGESVVEAAEAVQDPVPHPEPETAPGDTTEAGDITDALETTEEQPESSLLWLLQEISTAPFLMDMMSDFFDDVLDGLTDEERDALNLTDEESTTDTTNAGDTTEALETMEEQPESSWKWLWDGTLWLLWESTTLPFLYAVLSDLLCDGLDDLPPKKRDLLNLTGEQFAAVGALFSAAFFSHTSEDFLRKPEDFYKELEVAIELVSPGGYIGYMDIISTIIDLRLDEYLASPTFRSRIMDHLPGAIILALAAQVGYYFLSGPGVNKLLLTKLIEKQLTIRGFSIGELSNSSGDRVTSFSEEGTRTERSLAVNLNEWIKLFGGDAGDIEAGFWLICNTETDPESLELPETEVIAGVVMGTDQLRTMLEGGAIFTGEGAEQLESLMANMGLDYRMEEGSMIWDMGATLTYCHREGQPSGAMMGASSNLQYVGDEHLFAVGLAAQAMLSPSEPLNLSGVHARLSVTYLGDRSENEPPLLKVEISFTVNRQDWMEPNSPWLTEIKAKIRHDLLTLGFQTNIENGEVTGLYVTASIMF